MFPREDIQKTPVKEDDLADLPWAARSNAKLGDDYYNEDYRYLERVQEPGVVE